MRSTKAKYWLSAAIVCASATVLANHPSEGTPGWRFGGLNCGCVANEHATRLSCRLCCQNQATASHVLECLDFCDNATFPCLPSP